MKYFCTGLLALFLFAFSFQADAQNDYSIVDNYVNPQHGNH